MSQSSSGLAKLLLTPKEFLAAFEGAVGRNSLYEALRASRIRHIKLGRKILILASELEDWPKREAQEVA